MFVHYPAIRSEGDKSLDENQRVELEVVPGPKGLQTDAVHVLA